MPAAATKRGQQVLAWITTDVASVRLGDVVGVENGGRDLVGRVDWIEASSDGMRIAVQGHGPLGLWAPEAQVMIAAKLRCAGRTCWRFEHPLRAGASVYAEIVDGE